MDIGDLRGVMDRLSQELYPDQAAAWLIDPNGFLGGARPIDMLELGGLDQVLNAIDAMAEGAYA